MLAALGSSHDVVLTCAVPPRVAGANIDSNPQACELALAPYTSAILWAPAENALAAVAAPSSRLVRALKRAWDLLTDPIPFAYRGRFAAWAQMLAGCGDQFDAIVVRCIAMAPHTASVPGMRIIPDADDLHFMVLSQRAQRESGLTRVATRFESARTKRYEFSLFSRVKRELVSNTDDAARLREKKVSVLPNGVTLADVASVPRSTKTLVFVGHFGWPPNVEGLRWFLDNVWHDIQQVVPDVQLNVVGRKATPDLVGPRSLVGVHFAADVPEVGSWFAGAVASIAPLWEGSGTRIKIVESLGYGTPVVSTPIGAAGLTTDFNECDGLFLVGNREQMITTLVGILRDPESAAMLARSGAEKVRSGWTWQSLTSSLPARLDGWISPRRASV